MEVTFLQNARIEYIIIIKAFQQIKMSATHTNKTEYITQMSIRWLTAKSCSILCDPWTVACQAPLSM